MIYCDYGCEINYVDVTNIVLAHFLIDDIIHFPSGPKNFNQIFSDPMKISKSTIYPYFIDILIM